MIWEELAKEKQPFFALAPMNDVTDRVFRQMVAKCAAPDVFFSEFVSVDALAGPGRESMENKLSFDSQEHPLIVQVWGIDPKNYVSQCRELSIMGYSGIDINMGCPVAKIINKGACSALINDRNKAKEIIAAAKSGAKSGNPDVPVSVKTRIGFDEIDLSWIEFLLEQNLSALTVHCRTVQEQSNVANHVELLPEIVEMRNRISPKTILIANGDISTRTQGEELALKYDLDGIMIGRGVFSDPYVFDSKSKWNELEPIQKLNLYGEHIDLFDKTWQGTKNPDVLKKFAKTYIVGFKGAHSMREKIMEQRTIEGVREYLSSFIQ